MTLNHEILVQVQVPQQNYEGNFALRQSAEGHLPGMYYVYIIECQDDTLYTGITTDIERRFKEHRLGKGGAYTRSKKVVRVLYTEHCTTRSEALKRESEIKGWSRKKKKALISGSE